MNLFPIYNKIYREKYFSPKEFQFIDFNGVAQIQHNLEKKDTVLVYKKNR